MVVVLAAWLEETYPAGGTEWEYLTASWNRFHLD
jgi:hypothetical protein